MVCWKVLLPVKLIFDEYITRRPMNSKNTNKGGFEKSELKKWMDTVLLMAFPEELRDKIYGLTLFYCWTDCGA